MNNMLQLIIRTTDNFMLKLLKNLFFFFYVGIEIPKYVDTVTPQYKPKFDALVKILISICLLVSVCSFIFRMFTFLIYCFNFFSFKKWKAFN